jgi:hypothetical protein
MDELSTDSTTSAWSLQFSLTNGHGKEICCKYSVIIIDDDDENDDDEKIIIIKLASTGHLPPHAEGGCNKSALDISSLFTISK